MIVLEPSTRGRSARRGARAVVTEPADIYVLWLALLAASVLWLGWSQPVARHPATLLLFTVLAVAAGSQKLWMPNSPGSRVSIGYLFVVVGLPFLSLPETMLVAAASGLSGSLLNVPARPGVREILFNVSAPLLSSALAGVTLQVLDPSKRVPGAPVGMLSLFAAASVYFLTNSALAAIIVSRVGRRSLWATGRRSLLSTLSIALAGASLGVLMALAFGLPDRTLFYLSLPLAYALLLVHQTTLERGQERRQHARDLDRSARELYASFQRVGHALAAPLDPEALHQLIVDLCQEMLAPRMSGLCLWRDEMLQLVLARSAPTFSSGCSGSVAEAIQAAALSALERGQPTSVPIDGNRPGSTGALAFAVPLQSAEPAGARRSGVGALCVYYDPWNRLTGARREFLTGFATQAALALQNARLFQVEQDVADTMRRSLLPPARVEAPLLDISPVYEPLPIDAGCIGGDYYDVFCLENGQVVATIADVCGKGITAAVRTARCKYTVRAYAVEEPSPHQVLERANAAFMAQEPDAESFTTLAYALLDPRRGSLSLSVAGHPPVLLYRAATRRCVHLDAGGAALGVLPGEQYDEVLGSFGPGDVLLLYTDGVLEARRGDEEFGLERLEAELARVAGRSAREIAAALIAAARAFADGKLRDDVTLLVLKNTCGDAASGP
jgi:sigma-B regulation protein RsbU (phosphoserine phosphatase)